MAWRNIVLDASIPQTEITDLSLCNIEPPGFFQLWRYLGTFRGTNRSSLPSNKLAGNDTNYITMKTNQYGTFVIRFYYNSTWQNLSQEVSGNLSNLVSFVAAVDDDLQIGYFLGIYDDGTGVNNIGAAGGITPPYGTNDGHIVYTILTSAEYHQHDWHSVPAIGEHALSVINDDYINGGEEVTDAPATNFDSLEESTKLSALAEGHSSEFPVIESSAGKMTIKDNGNGTCDLRFYLVDKPFLKIAGASKNAYLSILQDTENGVAKPSIIYEEEE